MAKHSYYEYYDFNGAKFFTLILKPEQAGKFPVVVTRSPYVSSTAEKSEEELLQQFEKENIDWAENNYVLVFQHCRGMGKSSGDFVPYIYEREDGLALRRWIREQNFYNGQIFLLGGSYTASLHYSTAPFESDIKGAVFDVQDSERYHLWYRNGIMRRGHANWHFNLYKDKSGLKKVHTIESFSEFPLANLSERVLGERAEDFEQMLSAPRFEHPFWDTRFGGNEARDAISAANIPILLTTGYNDFYVGGMFEMWRKLEEKTIEKCALIVSPYNHGQSYDAEKGICFPKASVTEQFGKDYRIKWFNAILKHEEPFVKTGEITYYRTFENIWETGFYSGQTEELAIPLGTGQKTLRYDPQDPPAFHPEGLMMSHQDQRDDVISLYTSPMERDVFIKGQMKVRLTVDSDCDDTSFYVMIGIHTDKGDYALRHDITSVLYQHESYTKNEKAVLDFVFDEYAFALKQGQVLRVDIAPTDKNTYTCHSNTTENYSSVKKPQIAANNVFLEESFLTLPIES